MNKKIIIITGDPNSINSEIIFKTWKKLDKKVKKKIYLIGSFNLINKQFKKLKIKTKVLKIKDLNDEESSNNLKILDIPLIFKNPFQVIRSNAAKYVTRSLDLADKLAKKKVIKGIINCPINKSLLKTSNKIGVTEYFAYKCKVIDGSEVMMIYNKKLSVVPLTTHINIKNVSKNLNKNLIINKLESLNYNFKKIFKTKPKIGVLGLNPHNAEMRANSEEVTKIIPAISILKKKGINVKGPLVGDTVFINNYKNFDVLVGMYHDQVLAPFKTLFHFDAINITLGLRYLRVSPDHGPAIKLVGKNKANPSSLLQCIKFLSNN